MPIAIPVAPAPLPTDKGHHAVAFTDARLSKPPSEALLSYDILPQLLREKKQFAQYIQIDLAHLVMLVKQGIVKPDIARAIFPVLLSIRQGGAEKLSIDPANGTLLLQIETALIRRLGEDVAGNLHTARSRIDQGGTARRLYKRDNLLRVMQQVNSFHGVIIDAARQYATTTILYHTHMQQAQPGSLGHYFLSFADRLHDDFERCIGAFTRANRNPLGGVGLSGTSWPIDRQATTDLLGFDSTLDNSKLVREAFYAAEIATALGFVMATLNDLATDLHVWCSNEFNVVALDDSLCSTSSIFPQKRNPVALEAIRSAAGPAISWGSSALATFRGPGTGDQAVKSVPHLDAAFETTTNMLILAGEVVSTLKVKRERIQQLLDETWSTSSNLADELVKQFGLSFRQAHHIIARLVRICEDDGIPRCKVSPADVERAAMQTLGRPIKISGEALFKALDPAEFVRSRSSHGAVSEGQVGLLIKQAEAGLAENEVWAKAKNDKLETARIQLEQAISDIMAGQV